MTLLGRLMGRSATANDAEGMPGALAPLLENYSIEVMPKTAAKVDDFRMLLPAGTRIYIAHVDGTPIDDMVATARRLRAEGFAVMPHIPARSVPGRAALEDWVKRYRYEADVDQALLLGGGISRPVGDLESSIHLIETGLFDRHGFTRLHVAGHPEGNRDIDRDGSTTIVDEALRFKQIYSENTAAKLAIVTQFAFDAAPLIAWADRIAEAGVRLPIHLGIAGPTKLQTLLKFAVLCGVGPSISILQKRATDLSKLLVPYEPTDLLEAIAAHAVERPDSLIEQIHVFPLGGVRQSADWMNARLGKERLGKDELVQDRPASAAR